MGRVAFSAAAMLALAPVDPGPADATAIQSEVRHFSVLRDGQRVGQYRMAFRQDGESLEVVIDLAVEVRAGFLPLFVYRHSAREVWHRDQLQTLYAETYDNGTAWRVDGYTTGDAFHVEGPSGTVVAPPGVRPSSFWRADTVAQSMLLDTEKGRLVRISSRPVAASPHTGPVRGYTVTGEIDRPVEVWYLENRWALARFRMLGAQVEVRADDLAPAMRSVLAAQTE
jgi:hypothetical protein